MRLALFALATLVAVAAAQQTNPTATQFAAAYGAAAEGESFAYFVGTEDRRALCTREESAAVQCSHYVLTENADGTFVAAHSQPSTYDTGETSLTDIRDAESAWAHGGQHPLHFREEFR